MGFLFARFTKGIVRERTPPCGHHQLLARTAEAAIFAHSHRRRLVTTARIASTIGMIPQKMKIDLKGEARKAFPFTFASFFRLTAKNYPLDCRVLREKSQMV